MKPKKDSNNLIFIKYTAILIAITIIAFFIKDKGMTGQLISEQNETISANETIVDSNNNLVGKQIENEITFETTFTAIQKNEENLFLEFHHNSQTNQPVWIEGNIEYTLSSTTAQPFQNITLTVPKTEGIIPKFKLHVGTASDIFEFGKTIPTINFQGETTLLDRSDEKLDLKLTQENSKIEIKGLNNAETINAKIISTNKPEIKTDVFAADSIPIDNATITLPKKGRINTILQCQEFNTITNSCPTEWTATNIPYTENETHITFTVNHFSGYAGAEITIINVQSYPSLYGNWTVMLNTTGTANLTIRASNGTTWSQDSEETDLQFLGLKCGENTINHTWIDNSVFIQDYNCTELSYETSKPLTTGKHTLEFTYGDDVKYAYNDVTACGIQINTSTTLTQNLTGTGPCIIINDNSITLDCAGYTITGNQARAGILANKKTGTTIVNCNVRNFSHGIFLNYSNASIINNANISFNVYGINLTYANNNFINDSTIKNNSANGIYAKNSNNNTFFNLTIDSNYVNGMYIDYSTNTDITSCRIWNSTTNAGINIQNSMNNSNIRNSEIKYSSDEAITASALLNSTIKNNIVLGYTASSRGFDVKQNSVNNTIEGNTIANMVTFGIENSNSANNNIIENNTITNCKYGISLYIVNDTTIKNNTITDCAGGIHGIAYGGIRRARIIQNTITSCTNRSTAASLPYQYLPAGILIDTEYYSNSGIADRLRKFCNKIYIYT